MKTIAKMIIMCLAGIMMSCESNFLEPRSYDIDSLNTISYDSLILGEWKLDSNKVINNFDSTITNKYDNSFTIFSQDTMTFGGNSKYLYIVRNDSIVGNFGYNIELLNDSSLIFSNTYGVGSSNKIARYYHTRL